MQYGSDCRNLSLWRMKVTLSGKQESWEATTKENKIKLKIHFEIYFVFLFSN